jgi:pilus assembly protein CpaC
MFSWLYLRKDALYRTLTRARRTAAGRRFGVLLLVGLLPPGHSFADSLFRLRSPSHVARLALVLDQSQTVRIDRPFGEALIANPDIADVVPLTNQSVYLIGKRIGITRLTVLEPDKSLLGVIEVEVSYDIKGLRRELQRSVAGGQFRISTANGRVLLAGSVPDTMALAKAIAITEQFTASASNGDNGSATPAPAAQPRRQGQPAPAGAAGPPGTQVNLAINQQSGPSADARPKTYINALVVRAPQQVLLDVRFVEVQRSAARDLGFSWSAKSNRLDLQTGFTGFPSTNVPFGSFLVNLLDAGVKVNVLIEALEKKGVARRLAEPNLVALSGDTANFLAGGEFPFPVAQSNSVGAIQVTLEFKKFGVGLAFTPTVLADGQINLKIEPEVSDLDPNNTFTYIGGFTVPALVVRRASTTIEMRDGQSFAIAGLLQTNNTKNDKQLPWLGSVPVLGTLFASASYRKEESDLVIIVTPHLVQPAVPGQKLATPFDTSDPGNDRDYFLRRQAEIEKGAPGPFGHILEMRTIGSQITLKEGADAIK